MLVFWGQPGIEPGTSRTNARIIPLFHSPMLLVTMQSYLFSQIEIFPFLLVFPRISEFNIFFLSCFVFAAFL